MVCWEYRWRLAFISRYVDQPWNNSSYYGIGWENLTWQFWYYESAYLGVVQSLSRKANSKDWKSQRFNSIFLQSHHEFQWERYFVRFSLGHVISFWWWWRTGWWSSWDRDSEGIVQASRFIEENEYPNAVFKDNREYRDWKWKLDSESNWYEDRPKVVYPSQSWESDSQKRVLLDFIEYHSWIISTNWSSFQWNWKIQKIDQNQHWRLWRHSSRSHLDNF